jgi:hypothetical protein
MTIDRIDYINTQNSKLVIGAWFVGLAYYDWFASGPSLAWWVHLALIVVGMFISSIVIGGGMAILAAALNKSAFGYAEARPNLFKLAGLLATVIAFFAAKYAVMVANTISA